MISSSSEEIISGSEIVSIISVGSRSVCNLLGEEMEMDL